MVATRTLQILAFALADAGHAVVRFGWPGEAGSGDREPGGKLVQELFAALDAVADFAHGLSPDAPVDIVGLRLGALVTEAWTRSRAGGVDRQILWDPPASGRQWLRGASTMYRLTTESTDPLKVIDPPAGGFQTPGRLFGAAEAGELAELRYAPLYPDTSVRTQVLVRPGARRAGSGMRPANVEVIEVSGQENFIDQSPALAQTPWATIELIRDSLDRAVSHPLADFLPVDEAVVAHLDVDGVSRPVTEAIVEIDGKYGVLTTSNVPVERTAMTFPGGLEPDDGPGGLWMTLARQLAPSGVATLRLDLTSHGESVTYVTVKEPPEGHLASHIDDAEAGFDWLVQRFGRGPCLVGLCVGAWVAAHLAQRRRTPLLVLVNQVVWFNNLTSLPAWISRQENVADSGTPKELEASGVKQLLKERAPYMVWLVLARRNKANAPEPLLRRVGACGTRIRVLLSGRDERSWLGQRGACAERRMRRAGIDLEVVVDPWLDHSLFNEAGRQSALRRIIRMILQGPE
ncbi:alpha/beta fold hydrolase [Flexivirga caeni]|uniref:Alpha/beta fold hydrolase n=1 Tax=Flexivirga caeni TaxID=2294115 RepID=A0A3M9M6I6_9MICO|nr:alpha/beta fold hydrolase [Flexivirga caeni]